MGIEVSTRYISYDLAGKVQRQKVYGGTVSGDLGKLDDIFYYGVSGRPIDQQIMLGYDGAGNLKGYLVIPPGADGQYLYHVEYANRSP